MTREERNNLTTIFQHHVTQVSNLQFGNYGLAETLCQRTKMFSSKYFRDNKYYFYDLAKIDFVSSDIDRVSARAVWDEAYNRLVAISQAMLDEVQLSNSEPDIDLKKLAFSVVFLVVTTYMLWSFNIWAKGEWLSNHPKKIAIYLSFQVMILLISALILTNNKQGRFVEWVGIGLSGISLIISTVA